MRRRAIVEQRTDKEACDREGQIHKWQKDRHHLAERVWRNVVIALNDGFHVYDVSYREDDADAEDENHKIAGKEGRSQGCGAQRHRARKPDGQRNPRGDPGIDPQDDPRCQVQCGEDARGNCRAP